MYSAAAAAAAAAHIGTKSGEAACYAAMHLDSTALRAMRRERLCPVQLFRQQVQRLCGM